MNARILVSLLATIGIAFILKKAPLVKIQMGDIQSNIQVNIGNQNSPQTTLNNKINETKSPFEAEYRRNCQETESKESCKILAEELAKEKVVSQLCTQIKSQTQIKIGDQTKVEKQVEKKASGQLQGITVLKEGFEGNEYVYKIQTQNVQHLCGV